MFKLSIWKKANNIKYITYNFNNWNNNQEQSVEDVLPAVERNVRDIVERAVEQTLELFVVSDPALHGLILIACFSFRLNN